MTYPEEQWYRQGKGEVHDAVFRFVRKIEERQGDVYDRLAMLESLYDQYSPTGDDSEPTQRLANVSENLVASNIDTVYATSIAPAKIRPRYLTDGADWGMQRRAKRLEYYSEGLGKMLNVPAKCRLAGREMPKKGMGLVKVYATAWDEPAVEVTPLEEIVVPDCDSRPGSLPMQLHHVQTQYDRDRLAAEYPDLEEEINAVFGTRVRQTAGPRYADDNKITVIESIRLPIGKRPANDDKPLPKKKTAKRAEEKRRAKYVPGRRTVCIDGLTLDDEPYHDPYYPFAMCIWSERNGSFYPISGTERIMGIQRSLNKRNWQIERILDQNAMLTTYVRPSDFNLTVKTTKAGNIAAVKGDFPVTPNPPLVPAETYQSRRDLKESAPEQMGVSKFATQSNIPPGLETGAAVREYSARADLRFSPQEEAFEQFVLDVHWLLLGVCKKLDKAAPRVLSSRWHLPIEWADVDMGDVKVQISAASTLPRTAAGREATLIEWAQAGIISTDSVRRLMNLPDLDRELSMYTAALETIEDRAEQALDGLALLMPEPYDHLELFQWRVTGIYHNSTMARAPEEILEVLRDGISQCAFLIDQQKQAANQNAAAAAAAAGPMPGGMPGAGMPDMTQPAPALSPQAMQLTAA